jgi:hypothetical protein
MGGPTASLRTRVHRMSRTALIFFVCLAMVEAENVEANNCSLSQYRLSKRTSMPFKAVFDQLQWSDVDQVCFFVPQSPRQAPRRALGGPGGQGVFIQLAAAAGSCAEDFGW